MHALRATLSVALVVQSRACTAPAATLRLAQRKDLLPLASLIHDAFAAPVPDSRPYERRRSWLDIQMAKFQIALDIDQRMTPWAWDRHAQVVAVGASGQLLGYAEVWGEDEEALADPSVKTPQPVLFNLCVAQSARRSGVGNQLLQRCEQHCTAWGDIMYLKVRTDNDAAHLLYTSSGFEVLETRSPPPQPAWQERWKGVGLPLQLMRKHLHRSETVTSELARCAPPPPKRSRDFDVTLDQVLAYGEADALLWFALLIFRNSGRLLPVYLIPRRLVPPLMVLLTWATFYYILGAVFSTVLPPATNQ